MALTDLGVPTPKLIAEILSQQKETHHGLKFLDFLTEKITAETGTDYKSVLFKLLTMMMTRPSTESTNNDSQRTAVNIEANQVFVLKRLVKKAKFRKTLYMDEKTSSQKLDIISMID